MLTGRVSRFGLSGPYREIDDLRTGRFRWQAEYGISAAAEGIDMRGRWRMDASRRAHALDSPEAKTVAITESYLARRGYFAPQSDRLAAIALVRGTQRSRYDRVAVTPRGGRTALLWIARADHLVHRIDVQRAERVETIRYDDYRRIDGVALPFSIGVDNGDEPTTARIAVSTYRFLSRVKPNLFVPPAERSDVGLRGGKIARAALRAGSATMGFPVVLARINGHTALPFIVDTGGHDIVTPAAARQLGLKVVAGGVSFGAGAGSTRTAFTRVQRIALGGAEMSHQPFVVLYEDLGSARNAQGRSVPIAGILGLELFERFTVTLDFARGEIELGPRSAAFDTRDALPITFTSDEPLVDARVAGRLGSFAIDTGNNVGLIVYHRWLARSNVPGFVVLRDTMDGMSVGGSVSFRRARATSLELGVLRISGVPVLVADARLGAMSSRSEAGSIGTPNFSGFRVTFAYAAGKMMLSR